MITQSPSSRKPAYPFVFLLVKTTVNLHSLPVFRRNWMIACHSCLVRAINAGMQISSTIMKRFPHVTVLHMQYIFTHHENHFFYHCFPHYWMLTPTLTIDIHVPCTGKPRNNTDRLIYIIHSIHYRVMVDLAFRMPLSTIHFVSLETKWPTLDLTPPTKQGGNTYLQDISRSHCARKGKIPNLL